MNHGSLFSGIGGFDLASEWMGWNNIFQVEIDDFATKVLKKNFPNVKKYKDIYEFDGTKYRGAIDIISGGFPCQPFSHAGLRQGKEDSKGRYLWPQMLRIIREIKPSFVVGENVNGIATMENGGTLDNILSDLETEGYTTETFIIPSASIGTWHRRNRVWICAYAQRNPTGGAYQSRNNRNEFNAIDDNGNEVRDDLGNMGYENDSDTKGERLRGLRNEGKAQRTQPSHDLFGKCSNPQRFQKNVTDPISERGCSWDNGREDAKDAGELRRGSEFGRRDIEPRLDGMVNGLPSWVDKYFDKEPNVPRVAKKVKNKGARLKGLGNAICPQLAYEIFRAIDLIK